MCAQGLSEASNLIFILTDLCLIKPQYLEHTKIVSIMLLLTGVASRTQEQKIYFYEFNEDPSKLLLFCSVPLP